MPFSVCLIEPEGYKYSHFLYDYCKFLCFTIEGNGYECCIVKNKVYTDRINIILGVHNLIDPLMSKAIRQAPKYIIVQSEVLSEEGGSGWGRKEAYRQIYVPLMRQAYAVWDGLESNREYLRRAGVYAEIIPHFGYLPSLREVVHKKKKDIDFLYYGSLTPHRAKMIDALKKRGGNVECIFDEAAIFRNDYIARARINLAPNQTPVNDHITSRILYLLNNRSIVVVERCRDQAWVEHCFLSADSENWADLCMATLNRPDLEQLADQYFENYTRLDMTSLFQPLLDKLKLVENGKCPSGIIDSKDTGEQGVSTTDYVSEIVGFSINENEVGAGLTSIIILPHNRLDQTKKCLKSISKHTPEPHEIIFVDDGSTGETSKWLKRRVRENNNWRLVENKEDPGFAKAVNQGMVACRGEYILILDCQVVVSTGWLAGMLECLNRDSDVGIVGPMSNHIAGPQLVVADEYRSVDYLDKYAERFRERYRHRRISHRTISGFCMLFRRTMAEKMGLFDESFGTVALGAEDFCLRAALAGYRNYIAGDVFVHRFEDRNSIGNQPDDGSINTGNRKILENKWVLSTQDPLGKKLAALRATEKAAELHCKGMSDKAAEVLIDCIKIAPEAKEIYFELGRIFLELKRFAEALGVHESMPESAKDELKGLECAGYGKEGLGLDSEADSYAERMLSLDPDYPPAINLKGVLAYKNGEKEAAEECFKRALRADPGYGEAYSNLGVLRWAAGEVDEALGYLSKGFLLAPTVPDHSTLYYSAVSSTGTHDEAELLFREAKGLHPNNRNIVFLYIDTLIQQGKFSEAMMEIEDAMVTFGVDDGILDAALSVRDKIGPRTLTQRSSKKPTLSLCMIVKDEEEHLAKCLHSVRPVVDEMIVVDTGSSDRTKVIAQVFGAQVFDYPWTGDFSTARNHSLSKASGDWILIMDADEVLSPLDFKELKGITDRKSPAPAACLVVTRNYVNDVSMTGWTENTGQYPEEAGRGWVPSTKVRLFTRRRDIAFSQPVHETVESSLLKAKVPIYSCDIVVHHYGKLTKERDLEKGDHYYRLGKEKLDADPTNLKALIELARQAQTLGKYEEAIELWTKLLDSASNRPEPAGNLKRLPPSKPGLQSEAYLQLASACLRLDRLEDALAMAQKAMDFRPVSKEALQTYATCEILSGSIDKAIGPINQSLEMESEYPPALLLLAIVSCLRGEIERMQEAFEILRNKRFNITPGLNGVARQLQLQGKNRESLSILDAAIQYRIGDRETTQLLETVQKMI